ncbi:MAG: hypothetical protein PUP92_29220 [Rhizonema sp. PD38]|nr:hypothetical protein [Rhizonema sp. PD38]
MNKIGLIFLSSSTLMGSMLLTLFSEKSVKAANFNPEQQADNTSVQKVPQAVVNCSRQNCTGNAHLATFNRLFMAKVNQQDNQAPAGVKVLNFSEEESDAAIAKFGCDCPKSINALRQIRGITVGVEGEHLSPKHPIKPCADGKLNQVSGTNSHQ